MDDVKALIKEVLEKGYLMSLATVDEAGPWVSELVYVHDDALNVYWLSVPETRHSQAILKDPRVAATIGLCHGRDLGEKVGLQIQGVAEKIEGDLLAMAKLDAAKRGKPEPTREGEIFQRGQSWYRLRPTKIDLIHQPLFGYEKKFLTF